MDWLYRIPADDPASPDYEADVCETCGEDVNPLNGWCDDCRSLALAAARENDDGEAMAT